MSVTFFIGPFDPVLWQDGDPDPLPTTDFHILPGEYSQKLLERWPHAKSYSGTIGSWTLDEPDNAGIYVHLQPNLQYVSIKLGANFTDFILWHRQMVPSKYLLFLFNSSSWDSLKLYVDTTREEIQNFTEIREM